MLKAEHQAMYDLFLTLAQQLHVPTPLHDQEQASTYRPYSIVDLKRLTLAVAQDLAAHLDDEASSTPVARRFKRLRAKYQGGIPPG